MLELQDASRRLHQDLEHQISLERQKTQEAREIVERLQGEKRATEARYKKLELDFSNFRNSQAQTPEAQLQGEITHLTRVVAELERRLSNATQAKQRYKEQWTRALHEIGRLKQSERDMARDHLRKEHTELQVGRASREVTTALRTRGCMRNCANPKMEWVIVFANTFSCSAQHLRLQYLAREERELQGREQEELAHLQVELARLRASVNTGACSSCQQTTCVCSQQQADQGALQRLREEREILLRSGVYDTEDRIIQDLDTRIHSLLPSPS